MTNGPGKSDRPAVPEKSLNNAGPPAAEGMEGRGLATGNLPQQNASRTPSREDARSALERVRQAASKDEKLRFTPLLHHIYNLETLRMAYFSLKKEAAPGVEGETWRHYGETLEDNLQDLSPRLKTHVSGSSAGCPPALEGTRCGLTKRHRSAQHLSPPRPPEGHVLSRRKARRHGTRLRLVATKEEIISCRRSPCAVAP